MELRGYRSLLFPGGGRLLAVGFPSGAVGAVLMRSMQWRRRNCDRLDPSRSAICIRIDFSGVGTLKAMKLSLGKRL